MLYNKSAGTASCSHDRRQKRLKSFVPAQPKGVCGSVKTTTTLQVWEEHNIC